MVRHYELVYNDNGIERLDEHRKDIIHIIQLHLEEIFSLLEKDESVLYYETVNKNKLRYYDRFTCVKPYTMKSIITVFPSADGQSYILYALGGVDAPSIFFLRSRIETSFMNRISTFCSYFFDQF